MRMQSNELSLVLEMIALSVFDPWAYAVELALIEAGE